MNKYLTAIIGVLVGIIGILAGMFTSTNSKRKLAEKKSTEATISMETSEKIQDIVNKPTIKKPFKKKQSGKFIKLTILISFSCIITSCAMYEPICPNLVLIPRESTFKDVNFEYVENIGYVFQEDELKELYNQFEWARDTINKYEQQITLYNQFRKGIK